jgi:hypothetical protein
MAELKRENGLDESVGQENLKDVLDVRGLSLEDVLEYLDCFSPRRVQPKAGTSRCQCRREQELFIVSKRNELGRATARSSGIVSKGPS